MRCRRVYLCFLAVVAVLSGGLFAGPAHAQETWYAEYFANRDLSGGPALTRSDAALHFEWGGGSPAAGIPADNFSARWTRDAWFESGTYRFSYRSDDGIRIWVDSTLVVDDWRDREATWSSVDHVVGQGTHRVRVEYYEHSGGAAIQVGWERISGGSAWRGEYFASGNLSGSPAVVRNDPAIDFDWGNGSPASGLPVDNFSVRWTYTLGFTAGAYRFYASCDDGVRVFVDGTKVIDAWRDQQLPNTSSGDVTLTGGLHTVVVEYYEHGGEAGAHVWWNALQSFSGWQGRYYDNRDFRGGPALIRDDAAIDFDWGEGAPADWMPSDNFSVVWTRQITFAPGYYRFNVRADDGVRVWLDDALVMDYWQPQEYEWRYLDGTYIEGVHTLKVEYFEQAGNARVRFWWELSGTAPSPGTSPQPGVPVPVPVPGPWQAEYFDNATLAGAADLTRSDAAIDFNWGLAAPVAGIPADNFSVRWRGTFSFAAGRYTFTTYTDDGVRVTVDGRRIIDSWWPMRGYRSATTDLTAGTHTVEMTYFERSGAARASLDWDLVSAAVSPTPSTVFTPPNRAAPRSTACIAGQPLRMDAWPVFKTCHASGGWTAEIFVQGHGGDCSFTYAWEGVTQGGPTSGAMIFAVDSASYGSAIVGRLSVTSAGETISRGVYVAHPRCQ
ncbi:MAG: hypothetical protein JXD18_00300 [Anaerolineae bacterium]|nr:hypothetical protein [Anaerolineae bacterium]